METNYGRYVFVSLLCEGILWNILCLLDVLPFRLWPISLAAVALMLLLGLGQALLARLSKSKPLLTFKEIPAYMWALAAALAATSAACLVLPL